MNNHVTGGTYNITGQRLNAADGLPIANSNPGHTIHARLLVLDSSIPGTGDKDDKCVTQILTLSNRTGGDGDVYVRTGRASSKNLLAGGYGWEQWAKLQQNVQVGQVTSLNSYTENGMYSGVYVNGNGEVETFVMVVINNYAVAGANGKVRSVSQFKYALTLDGMFSYRSRSGQGNTGISWGEWSDLNGATTAMLQDGSVTAQKLSADIRSNAVSPLRPLFIAAGAEYNDTGADKTKTAPWGETVIHKAGHYYLNGLGDITEEQMMRIYHAGKISSQTPLGQYKETAIRTTIKGNYSGSEGQRLIFYYLCSNNRSIEVFNICTKTEIGVSNLRYAFDFCEKLKYIVPIILLDTRDSNDAFYAFNNCYKLILCRIKSLKVSISFSKSSLISKDSVVYTIQNAAPSTAITITLHPDAYARLADDADIVAALEAQSLVSLVSA